MERPDIESKLCVVKVGTRVLCDENGVLNLAQIDSISNQIVHLKESGMRLVLVSSGAVGAGIGSLGLNDRPNALSELQAVASVGQANLINLYQSSFLKLGVSIGQVLLIGDDFEDRKRYLNIRNTINALHGYGVIPIVNENDTVSVDELTGLIGDNDQLAAKVANLLRADLLIVLTDVDGLFDGSPSESRSKRIGFVESLDESTFDLISDQANSMSRGGMRSKLVAVQMVTQSGGNVLLANGRTPQVLHRLFNNEDVGTFFQGNKRNIPAWKRWIGYSAQPKGLLTIDAGAVRALSDKGRSLLPIGILSVEGDFEKGDVVSLRGEQGIEIARGLSNYDSAELQKIIGLPSSRIAQVIGHCTYEEVIHRNNMTLFEKQD